MKTFKVQSMLVPHHNKRNDRKIIVNSSDSDNDEAFKSMHQGIRSKIKIQIAKIVFLLKQLYNLI